MAEKYTQYRANRNGTRPAYARWGLTSTCNNAAKDRQVFESARSNFARAASQSVFFGAALATLAQRLEHHF